MTFLQAAAAVLRNAEMPLTAQEITDIAIGRRLVRTKGKTPAATMSAALYGAPGDGPIRRVFEPGRARAVRGSVRWMYVEKAR